MKTLEGQRPGLRGPLDSIARLGVIPGAMGSHMGLRLVWTGLYGLLKSLWPPVVDSGRQGETVRTKKRSEVAFCRQASLCQ